MSIGPALGGILYSVSWAQFIFSIHSYVNKGLRFKIFTAHECYKSSQVISCINVELKTNVLETSSVSIITNPDDGDRASLRTLVFDATLMWLIAQEDFFTKVI
jgi:hypothetical protein